MSEKDITNSELVTRFTYHPPSDDQPQLYEGIRAAGLDFAEFIANTCPSSRELSMAIMKIEEAVFWANSAVARRS